MDMPVPPPEDGQWTLLQNHINLVMWQQDVRTPGGVDLSRFWIVTPAETLTYDTFDEAEEMMERLGEDVD